MIAGDPMNAWARTQLGRVYLATGKGWAAARGGGRAGGSAAERACSYFRRSAETLRSLQAEERLPGVERPLLEEAQTRRRACESARGGL